MTRNIKTERRQYPRIDHRLPLKVAADGYDFATSTQNVSCIGAYCYINKYVPPFTKVVVKLTLPVNASDSSKNYDIECRGVVVRTEDEEKGGFNIAIYFNHMNIDQQKKISEFISQFLPEKFSAAKRV